MTPDGRFVAFLANLGEFRDNTAIYLWDAQTGINTLVSVSRTIQTPANGRLRLACGFIQRPVRRLHQLCHQSGHQPWSVISCLSPRLSGRGHATARRRHQRRGRRGGSTPFPPSAPMAALSRLIPPICCPTTATWFTTSLRERARRARRVWFPPPIRRFHRKRQMASAASPRFP